MRISRRSIPSLILAAGLGLPYPALAQGPRAATVAEGGDALARLKAAVIRAQAKDAPLHRPTLPPPPADALRQRAAAALRNRVPAPPIDARARSALARGRDAMAAERERQADRLRQALGLAPADAGALARAVPAALRRSWVPLLFVSSSMPLAVLRSYVVQLERVHGVIALRGMPGGLHKVAPMARLAADMLRIDAGCDGPACAMRDVQLIVDPIAFREHGVERVPALAMVPGDPAQAYCERDGQSPRARHVVYGDSALAGLLDEYARLGGGQEVHDAQALLAAR